MNYFTADLSVEHFNRHAGTGHDIPLLLEIMDTESEVLSGQFEILPTKKSFLVTLTRKSLAYSKGAVGSCPCVGRNRSAISVKTKLVDVYGARAYRGPDGDIACYFQVYSCPLLEKKRVRRKICFKVASFDSEESNAALAEKWVRTILWLVKEPEKTLGNIEGKIFLFHT